MEAMDENAGALLVEVAPLDPEMTCEEALERFIDEAGDFESLAVVRDGQPLGIVLRATIIEKFSQRYFREIFGRRPVTLLMNPGALAVDRGMALDSLGQQMADESARRLHEGFIITDQGRYAGMGTGQGLLRQLTVRKDALLAAALERASAGMLLAQAEVMEKQRIEQELAVAQEIHQEQERAQRRLADVLEFLPDATLVLDADHRVMVWNRAMVKMTGVGKEQMVGQVGYAHAAPFYGELRPTLADAVLERAVSRQDGMGPVPERQDVMSQTTFVARLRKGRGAWLDKTASVLIGPEGRVAGAIESIRDITEQKDLEAQLAQAHRLEAIGTLAGGIAHDFNNILAAVGGYAELALTRRPGREMSADLEGIMLATDRAAELVRQILAFSRVRPEAPRVLAPMPLVAEALKMLRATVPSTVVFDTRLACRRSLLADPGEIHRVVMNLCTNAAMALSGHGRLSVRLEDLEPGPELLATVNGLRPIPYIVLTVEDDGQGMSSEVKNRIFEPFFTTRGVSGTGMGLAVVHGIVQARGGVIQVDSALGHGSVFRIFLPATEQQPEAAKPAPPPQSARGMGRLLVVDDEPALVDILSMGLSRSGFEVKGFTSSPEALEHFRRHPSDYDLMITDFTMPNLTGPELAAQCKALQPCLKVLLCTGYDKEDSRDHGGAVDLVVTKPIGLAGLRGHISGLLEASKASAP